ncbi:MAG TPA: YqaE/Pmp3 family membrane protein [Candidatus Saccharimonadales bacterium]|nr:YqaE/Pmp3 family membrane protein [Candidatus Saccharimonadales bacterium]
MRYLLAILLPPVAMLTVGKPFQAILCLILMVTLIAWPLAAIWAVLVVHSSFADSRNRRIVAEMRKQRSK